MKTSMHLTAVRLRPILVILLLLIIGLGVAGFLYANQQLSTYAAEVGKREADANASEDSVTVLKSIESQLETYSDAIDDAANLTIKTELPQFQAVEAIQRLSDRAQIEPRSITFGGANTGTEIAPGATQPTPTTAPTAGAKGVDITVQLPDTIPIERYLQFLALTESTTPKMQVKDINLIGTESTGSITGGQLVITVYTE